MKAAIICFAILLASQLAFGRGGDISGGGDPLSISAVSYPDPLGLDQAISVVQDQVEASPYSEDFKGRVLSETHALRNADQFRLLPALIILGPGAGPEGYTAPQDQSSFVALGGMTRTRIGAPVYLAERVTRYSPNDLAAVLLHEVIHHVVSPALAEDEDFVRDLTQSIASGTSSMALQVAMTKGIYVRPEYISARQFLDVLGLDKSLYLPKKGRERALEELKMALLLKLPQNLADLPLWWLSEVLAETSFWGDVRRNDPFLGQYNRKIQERLMGLSKEFDPNSATAAILSDQDDAEWGCKHDISYFAGFFTRGCKSEFRVKDLISLPK